MSFMRGNCVETDTPAAGSGDDGQKQGFTGLASHGHTNKIRGQAFRAITRPRHRERFPGLQSTRPVITFSARVPVLAEQMTVVLPHFYRGWAAN